MKGQTVTKQQLMNEIEEMHARLAEAEALLQEVFAGIPAQVRQLQTVKRLMARGQAVLRARLPVYHLIQLIMSVLMRLTVVVQHMGTS